MASVLPYIVVLVLCVILPSNVYGGSDCDAYRDLNNNLRGSQTCWIGFCCGDCHNRFCCSDMRKRLSEEKQEDCFFSRPSDSPAFTIIGAVGGITILLIIICCFVCPCCCLYKSCRRTRPVVATTTTVVTTGVQQYPRQPNTALGQPQSYQGTQYLPYQAVPVQPGYPAQPAYGPQPMPSSSSSYQGQPFSAGPPPTYQEATGPKYPPNPMPYSQAAFSPGQPTYPLQPLVQPQPGVPPVQHDYLAQPAYNPDYVAPPPKTG